eukprot:TRINITY_DN52420_c0_g1_i2.p1 TRINITY_DN52420_c0_g1~~TRINITY_DN52420_c0_g1_i2.p1  ORF type:complete len:506 (-),score=133.13 TRINITY_DN52420_c0_g1_i2:93-1610(-)
MAGPLTLAAPTDDPSAAVAAYEKLTVAELRAELGRRGDADAAGGKRLLVERLARSDWLAAKRLRTGKAASPAGGGPNQALVQRNELTRSSLQPRTFKDPSTNRPTIDTDVASLLSGHTAEHAAAAPGRELPSDVPATAPVFTPSAASRPPRPARASRTSRPETIDLLADSDDETPGFDVSRPSALRWRRPRGDQPQRRPQRPPRRLPGLSEGYIVSADSADFAWQAAAGDVLDAGGAFGAGADDLGSAPAASPVSTAAAPLAAAADGSVHSVAAAQAALREAVEGVVRAEALQAQLCEEEWLLRKMISRMQEDIDSVEDELTESLLRQEKARAEYRAENEQLMADLQAQLDSLEGHAAEESADDAAAEHHQEATLEADAAQPDCAGCDDTPGASTADNIHDAVDHVSAEGQHEIAQSMVVDDTMISSLPSAPETAESQGPVAVSGSSATVSDGQVSLASSSAAEGASSCGGVGGGGGEIITPPLLQEGRGNAAARSPPRRSALRR